MGKVTVGLVSEVVITFEAVETTLFEIVVVFVFFPLAVTAIVYEIVDFVFVPDEIEVVNCCGLTLTFDFAFHAPGENGAKLEAGEVACRTGIATGLFENDEL